MDNNAILLDHRHTLEQCHIMLLSILNAAARYKHDKELAYDKMYELASEGLKTLESKKRQLLITPGDRLPESFKRPHV